MKRIFLLLLGGIMLVGSGDAIDGERGWHYGSGTLGLLYIYSSADSGHIERILRLRDLAENSARPFDLVVIARAAESAVMDLKVATGLKVALVERMGRDGDYAVLVEADGSIRVRGSGREIERLLERSGSAFVSTDISESTWGKIKDLFQ